MEVLPEVGDGVICGRRWIYGMSIKMGGRTETYAHNIMHPSIREPEWIVHHDERWT